MGTAQLLADEALARSLQFADFEAGAYDDMSAGHDDDGDDGGAYQLDVSDDDYSTTRGKGKKRSGKKGSAQGPAKRGRKPKAPAAIAVLPSTHAGNDALLAPAAESDASSAPGAAAFTAKSAAAATPDMTGILQGRWTDAEEQAFLEGLDLYGRDWKKLTSHIKTRLCDGVKSHAQKHFIHLWLAGQPLPDKVRESGDGHTLSGNPLNPESAALRPYLKSSKRANTLPENVTNGSSAGPAESNSGSSPIAAKEIESKADRKPPKRKDEAIRVGRDYALPARFEVKVGPDGKTDYSRNRPRRETRAVRGAYAEDEYDLVACPPFGKGPEDIQQPYTLTIERTAVALIDLHSHLLDTEVVGLLAGTYDEQAKACKISMAIPAKRKALESRDASITVEASEESLAAALATADAHGLHIVGWYHSHPVFATLPSRIDCETQRMHQTAFGGGEIGSGGRPFLGAICGPYNPELKTSQSELNWFVVPTTTAQSGHPHCHHHADDTPRQLTAVLTGHDVAASEGVSQTELDNMLELTRAHAQPCYDSDRHVFSSIWRRKSTISSPPTVPATTASDASAAAPAAEGVSSATDDENALPAAALPTVPSPPASSSSSPSASTVPSLLLPQTSSPTTASPADAPPPPSSSPPTPATTQSPRYETRAAKLAASVGAWLLGPHYNGSLTDETTTSKTCTAQNEDGIDYEHATATAAGISPQRRISVRELLCALMKELSVCDERALLTKSQPPASPQNDIK
ncbi:hypothetical protein HDU86_000332 [Geranomyces michiganensis]|nr:hypothetical protein HDU86_000332 [Geranomyces michiganensis]